MKKLLLILTITFLFNTYAWAIQNPFTPQIPRAKEIEATTQDNNNTNQKETSTTTKATDVISKAIPEVVLPELIIKGIIWHSERPQAIINGEVIDEGDIVDEVKILKINKNNMDVIYNGINKTISY